MLRRLINIILLSIGILPASVFAATYAMPSAGNDIIGQAYYVKAKPGDTLGKLGLRYGMSYHEMMEANPRIQPDRSLRGGERVLIPAQFILPPYRKGIVINLPELRMYYFPPNGQYVMTFPVAMGRDEWRTPTVQTTVVSKEPDPVWRVPESIREYHYQQTGEMLPEAVQPGPDNPLGHYALHLGIPGYLIHGNNSPSSIGKYVSSGCIRMNNADIETLFNMVSVGTPVYVIHYPNKVGWQNGVLYQESQKPVDIPDAPSALNQTSVSAVISQETEARPAKVDWDAVEQVNRQTIGIPEPIGESPTHQVQATNGKHHLPAPTATPVLIESNADDSASYQTTDVGAQTRDNTYGHLSSWTPAGGNT